jgi:hypothetical protein
MIAENLYSSGFNILYPQVKRAGSNPGHVGTEFQLVAFIASLVYLLLGVQPWIGRSVSVFFFGLSVPFLYLLVKNTVNTSRGSEFDQDLCKSCDCGRSQSRFVS